jgi:hypothetical protein
MIKQIVLTSLMLFSGAFAVAKTNAPVSTQKIPFKANWVQSKKYTMQVGGTTLITQMHERIIPMADVAIPVATMTTGEITAKDAEDLPQDFIGGLGQLMKIKKWKEEKRGSYTAYEAVMPEYMRYVKVFVSKEKNTFKYSLVTMRVAYMLPAYFEAELIQREEIGDLKGVAELRKSNNTYARIYEMMVTPAHAQNYGVVGNNLLNYIGGWQPGQISQITQGARDAANNIGNSINNAASSLSRVEGTVNGFANRMESITTGAERTIDRNMASATQRWDETNKNWAESNRVANKAISPKTVATLTLTALGTASAYNLGVHFLTETIPYLARETYYMVTGNLKPEIREQMIAIGGKAWDDIDRLSVQAMELDLKLQAQVSAMEYASSGNFVNDMQKLQAIKANALKSYDFATSQETKVACMNVLKTMQTKIVFLEGVGSIIQAARTGRPEMCAGFDEMYRQWIQTEGALSIARDAILQNSTAVMKKMNSKIAEASLQLASDRSLDTDCEKSPDLDRTDKQIAKEGCNDTAIRSEICADLLQMRKYYLIPVQTCRNMEAGRKNLDPVKEEKDRARLMAATAQMMGDSYDRLLKSNCRIGVRNALCDGQSTGLYANLKDDMSKNFKKAAAMCGNLSTIRIAPETDVHQGAQMAAAQMAGPQPLASNEKNHPSPNQGGGFVSKIMDAIAKPLKWIGSFFGGKSS